MDLTNHVHAYLEPIDGVFHCIYSGCSHTTTRIKFAWAA